MTVATGRARPASWVGVVVVAILLAGCATSSTEHRQAEAMDDGVQVTGTLDGARIAISEGVPDVLFGDCDPGFEVDDDVCWSARTIDGMMVSMVIENPDVLVPGETVEVVTSDCVDDCDTVTEGVVVEIRADGRGRRAVDGRLEVERADERVAADFDVTLPDADRLTGSFNVRELRPGER
ncbi:hypothetical protein [Salsipaludibacter albus]|uniref:hypothetical protein n=1 Tax=Salsipaludibacter albus TaxID=2849650 RepID=UPI001EE3CE88|nr:hypothetical protein [Salsipaludibacter albus]MBY5163089.1 hypothetical protein [Salsipaludibacter albus]